VAVSRKLGLGPCLASVTLACAHVQVGVGLLPLSASHLGEPVGSKEKPSSPVGGVPYFTQLRYVVISKRHGYLQLPVKLDQNRRATPYYKVPREFYASRTVKASLGIIIAQNDA
jgi:hypothetical protein